VLIQIRWHHIFGHTKHFLETLFNGVPLGLDMIRTSSCHRIAEVLTVIQSVFEG